MNEYLTAVKEALNITGEDQDAALLQWIKEVLEFIKDAGVKPENITKGLIARGVSDLWNYGAGDGRLSEYFCWRVTQLSYK
jgi:hypothetical protein